MKLNHINLTVSDVTTARKFLVKYFDLEDRWAGKENKNIAVLFDDDGMVITLIKASDPAAVTYPESFHIGFMQESNKKVNEINKRLKDDGYEVEPPGKSHGAWTFYFEAPGGFTVEVLC